MMGEKEQGALGEATSFRQAAETLASQWSMPTLLLGNVETVEPTRYEVMPSYTGPTITIRANIDGSTYTIPASWHTELRYDQPLAYTVADTSSLKGLYWESSHHYTYQEALLERVTPLGFFLLEIATKRNSLSFRYEPGYGMAPRVFHFTFTSDTTPSLAYAYWQFQKYVLDVEREME